MDATATKQPSVNWFRTLKGDRLEVCLAGKTEDGVPLRMRASGTKEHVWEVVDMFEEMTGLTVEAYVKRPPRSGARPLAGQLAIFEQLRSEDEDGA